MIKTGQWRSMLKMWEHTHTHTQSLQWTCIFNFMIPVGFDLWPQIVQQMKKAGKDHLLTLVQYPEAGHLIEPPYTPHFRATRFNRNGEREATFGLCCKLHFPERWSFAFQPLLCGGERPNLIQMLRKTPGGRSWRFYSSTFTPTRLPEQRFESTDHSDAELPSSTRI